MKRFFTLCILAALLVMFSLPTAAAQGGRSYLIQANRGGFAADFAARVSAAGGTLTRTIPEIGIAFASSSNPSFASQVTGVASVVPNLTWQWIDPVQSVVSEEGDPPNSGNDDPLFDLQWGHTAVRAQEAWAAGARGDGVRVAVLDSGIDAEHPDLAPNLNTALSTSFVPGEGFNIRPGLFFNHGTHVAGTIGAADNAFGVIGVAPEVELVAVKVLSEFTGSGSFEGVIAGIIYATNIGADVINMSLGATIPARGGCGQNGDCVSGREVAELKNAISRATTYAYQRGVTVIVSAGNSAIDRDHDASVVVLPADAAHVITISATAPEGWALNPNTNLDILSSFSNFGQSAIDFAAPGGDFDLPGEDPCTVAGRTRACWIFDMVFSTVSQGWGWAAGTSMAAPHTSGIAALIIGQNGGSMAPAHVEAALRAYADDLGKPGNDDAYGAGRVTSGY